MANTNEALNKVQVFQDAYARLIDGKIGTEQFFNIAWNSAIAASAEAAQPVAEMVYFQRVGSSTIDCLPVAAGTAELHVNRSLIVRIDPLFATPQASQSELCSNCGYRKTQQGTFRCNCNDGQASQSEKAAMDAGSVKNILLRVVPGDDGMGKEIYANSVADVEALLAEMGARLETLEGENVTLRALASAPAQQTGAPVAVPSAAEQFCDANCVWTDHHPTCLMMTEKTKEQPPGPLVNVLKGDAYAEQNGLEVTSEWIRGWDACRNHASSMRPEITLQMTAAGMRTLEKVPEHHFHKFSAGIANAVFENMISAAPAPVEQTEVPVNVPSGVKLSDLDDFRLSIKGLKYMDIDPVEHKDVHNKAIDECLWMLENFVKHLAAAPAPVQAEAQPKDSYPTMTLNGYQLKDVLGFIAPDDTAEQLEMEVSIAILPSDKAPLDDDNKRMPAGAYAWITDYPEEGCIPLLEDPTSMAQPAPEAQQSEKEKG